MKILTLEQIKKALPSVDLMHEIELGFVAYSRGEAVVPPVGELVLEDPPGEVHIKYGYLQGDAYYVIKFELRSPALSAQDILRRKTLRGSASSGLACRRSYSSNT